MEKRSLMKVNSVYGLLLAVQSGVGLAVPDYITYNISGITKDLPNERNRRNAFLSVFLENIARLMAFENFLFSKVNEWKFISFIAIYYTTYGCNLSMNMAIITMQRSMVLA